MIDSDDIFLEDAFDYNRRIIKGLSTLGLLWNSSSRKIFMTIAASMQYSDTERFLAFLMLFRHSSAADEPKIFSQLCASKHNMDRRYLLRCLNWSQIRTDVLYDTFVREAHSINEPEVALFAQQCLLQLPPNRWIHQIQIRSKSLTPFLLKLMSIGHLQPDQQLIASSRHALDPALRSQAEKSHAICFPKETYSEYMRLFQSGKALDKRQLEYLSVLQSNTIPGSKNIVYWLIDLAKKTKSEVNTIFFLGLCGCREAIPICLKLLENRPDLTDEIYLALSQITGISWRRDDTDEDNLSDLEIIQNRYRFWKKAPCDNTPRSLEGFNQRIAYTNMKYWRSRRRELRYRCLGTQHIPDLAPISVQFDYLKNGMSHYFLDFAAIQKSQPQKNTNTAFDADIQAIQKCRI